MTKKERINKVIKQLEKQKYLVVTDHGSSLYSFNELLDEFGFELKIVDDKIGFWEVDYNEWGVIDYADWYSEPMVADPSKWQNIMSDLLNSIFGYNRGILAIACVKNDNFVVTL